MFLEVEPLLDGLDDPATTNVTATVEPQAGVNLTNGSATLNINELPTLGNVTVSGNGGSATATDGNAVDLYLPDPTSGSQKITISGPPANSHILWSVAGSNNSSTGMRTGFGSGNPTIALSPTSSNHTFTITVGVDENGNGVLDSSEVARTIIVDEHDLRLAWSTDSGSTLSAFRVPLLNGEVTPLGDVNTSHDLGDPSVLIDWGDGTDPDEGLAPHFYDEPGTYTVTVESGAGLTTTTSFEVTVIDTEDTSPAAPPFTFGPNRLGWDPVPYAVNYDINSGTTDSSGSMVYLASTTSTEYEDDAPVAPVTYYQIIANMSDGSSVSLPILASAGGPQAAGAGGSSLVTVVPGSASMSQAEKDTIIQRTMQDAAAKTPSNGKLVGIVDIKAAKKVITIGGVNFDVHYYLYSPAVIAPVAKDGAGALARAGGYSVAKRGLYLIAQGAKKGVISKGNGTLELTMPDNTVLTLKKDGDWGTLTVDRQGIAGVVPPVPPFDVKFENRIHELNFRAPGVENGNIDGIDNLDTMIEEKGAKGLLDPLNLNADGSKKNTEANWAAKNIYKKEKNRIEAIQAATSTFKGVGYVGPDALPTVGQIKALKKVVFEIEGDWPELESAVNAQILQLQKDCPPEYSFKAIFDVHP